MGEPDPVNPSTISRGEIERWRQEVIEPLGYQTDIADVFAKSNLVVLPLRGSKVLIEAAACGKTIITTDVPGCRDAIEPNVTGLWCRSAMPHL